MDTVVCNGGVQTYSWRSNIGETCEFLPQGREARKVESITNKTLEKKQFTLAFVLKSSGLTKTVQGGWNWGYQRWTFAMYNQPESSSWGRCQQHLKINNGPMALCDAYTGVNPPKRWGRSTNLISSPGENMRTERWLEASKLISTCFLDEHVKNERLPMAWQVNPRSLDPFTPGPPCISHRLVTRLSRDLWAETSAVEIQSVLWLHWIQSDYVVVSWK